MAREQGEEGHVVGVAGQEGTNALVALPMVGFPEGFQLPRGARVVLVTTPSGPAVRPLARGRPGPVPPEAVEQDATVVGEQPRTAAPGPEEVVWVVESSDPETPDQVIAVRRPGG
jgi:hypothetical protein